MALWNVTAKLGYATWPAKLVKDPHFAETIYSEKVDILLNIHSLFIIHPEVLKVPRIGSFNMHAAALPRYAGLNAVSWAIYRGERTHGVTIHQMVPEIDAGPIVYQVFFDSPKTLRGVSTLGRRSLRTVDSHGHVPRVTWSTSCGHATYFLFAHHGASPKPGLGSEKSRSSKLA